MRTYWAADPVDKLGHHMRQKIDSYRSNVLANGRMSLWRRSVALYYGLDPDGTRKSSHYIGLSGQEGELVTMRGNMYRAFVRKLLVLTVGSRPSLQCRPIAYDATTSEIVTLGNAICDRYLDESAESTIGDAILYAITLGEGWLASTWDDSKGKIIGQAEDGRVVHEGDCSVIALRPDQVVRDTRRDGTEHDWIIIQRQRSRWDLAAQYPQHRDEILRTTQVDVMLPFFSADMTAVNTSAIDDDQIVVWELYHRPTDALPKGRCAFMVGDTVIADGPNVYGCIPVFPAITSREPGGPYGYGEAWDLLAPQAMYDSILTQMCTTQEAFGLRNIFVQTGTLDTNPMMIGQGLRVLQGSAPPIPIDLGQGSTEQCSNAMSVITGIMQVVTGLNDASFGDAGKSASGASVAMQSQLAAQFNSGLQRTYAGLLEKGMTQVIKNLQQFASVERMIHIAGANRAPLIKRFKADDLQALDGVTVEIGSAAMRSTQMRIETAQTMLSGGLITSPEQYLEVQATGRLEPVTEGPRANEVRSERMMELVMSGKGYTPLATDPHEDCIRKLSDMLDDEEFRNDGMMVQAVTSLIQQHAEMWISMSQPTNPMGIAILQSTGQQPCAAAQMMPPAPMPPGDPNAAPPGPPNQNPGPIPGNDPVIADTAPPEGGAAQMPRLPREAAGTIQ
jgi:hypothetical protein